MSTEPTATVRTLADRPDGATIRPNGWVVSLFEHEGELAFLIPPEVIRELGLYDGCAMDMQIEDGAAIFTKRPKVN